MILLRWLFGRLWRLLPDNCAVCGGRKGGIRGNENIVNGTVMCDYCEAEYRKLAGTDYHHGGGC